MIAQASHSLLSLLYERIIATGTPIQKHILANVFQALGLNPKDNSVQISGHDPILPSPFLIGEAGAAALAAFGHLISQLWTMKTKRHQDVKLSVRDAALSQLSHAYLKLLDTETPPLWDPISGFYHTQDDRWIQFHCNFPHHRQGVVDFLQCENTREAVSAAVEKNWTAEALETALAERALCAAMVRTPEEWAAHLQGQALSKLPLMEVIKIGESAPEFKTTGTRPLANLRALDLSRVIAGPVCGKILGEQGATVMRIESPHLPFVFPLYLDTSQGKLSSFLDLDQAADHAQLKALIQEADVFLQAYHPGALAKKGFSPEALARLRPGIIYVNLSAYSHEGPFKDRHGFDSLVQSATGVAYEQSQGKTPPKHLPAQALDYITGYLGAAGVLAALKRRATEGGSYLVRVSLAQTAHWLQHIGRISDYSQLAAPKAEQIPELLCKSLTPYGRLQHMRPVLQFSETPSTWSRPLATRGSDSAEWPLITTQY